MNWIIYALSTDENYRKLEALDRKLESVFSFKKSEEMYQGMYRIVLSIMFHVVVQLLKDHILCLDI